LFQKPWFFRGLLHAPSPVSEKVLSLSNYPLIVYQRPGYVAPEELLHRIITQVGEHSPTRVLINAVDQWDAAYPLLANSNILLPTLVDFFSAHGVTSMVIGVEPQRGALSRYGLTATAEVVLSFDYRRIPWPIGPTRPSTGLVGDAFPSGAPLATVSTISPLLTQPKVIVRAERVPRGGAGFGRAVLQNTTAGASTLAGLEMVPLAPEYPEGDPV
jgi:hypothetical protein